MCARDNGVEILIDGHIKRRVFIDDSNAKEMFIKALERVEEQNAKGYKLTDCDKNSWWEDFKVYTTYEQILSNSSNIGKVEHESVDKIEPKFHEGDIIIHKELGGDYIHNPHKIIQVDILDKKYRLEGGLVAHFGEQDDYELLEQKPAWSEEDEKVLQDIIYNIGLEATKHLPSPLAKGKNETNLYIDWLKSLKNKLQFINQEWSKKDENKLNRIYEILPKCIDCHPIECKELQDWLKSLKERYTWKPSEEQIEALESVTENCAYSEYQDCLRELIGQLKKLRDE
jgi:hypothetical protein